MVVTIDRLSIQQLWSQVNFRPNENQERAILHQDCPLFLTAGPGSGKTRVLLWRTLNLIVFEEVKPEEIFLSTFTEKAAFQLREGLRSLLGLVTNLTGIPYDISKMYVGTVHSLCQKLMKDRRLSKAGKRPITPVLKDALGQYFYISRRDFWKKMTQAGNLSEDSEENLSAIINEYFGSRSGSRHVAVTNCISLFNRFSEECIEPSRIREHASDGILQGLIDMYAFYQNSLNPSGGLPQTDFSLVQQQALKNLEASAASEQIFKHVIIDEYQDTNTIQEKLFFKLAVGHQNICVVGDDDQALYRFRGATVENFVEFPQRCQKYLKCDARKIPLNTNYRSRQGIVDFYSDFIVRCNWRKSSGTGHYRIINKNIQAHSQDKKPSVIASTAAKPDAVCAETAQFVRQLIDTKKVQDPNQIAFLYPSLKSKQVQRMIDALEEQGLKVYAPRAGRFLEVEEAISVFGVYLKIFGKPARGSFLGRDYEDFYEWMNKCESQANLLIQQDKGLATYIRERTEEIKTVTKDYQILLQVARQNQWDLKQPYDIAQMQQSLCNASGISIAAKKAIGSSYLKRVIEKRIEENNPFSLSYVINAATSVDWSVLDLFYQLCIFDNFKAMFDRAEKGEDEGPICNLSLVTQYLARFTDEFASVITAQFLSDNKFQVAFFISFLYGLFRLGESEYENADDPFPKGRIPFLTIHQSKGLEFPVVVLGNPRKDDRGPQKVEQIVKPFVEREGEPLERISTFDIMRMFYVALSRAKNLLVITHYRGNGQKISEPFSTILSGEITRIPNFDTSSLPEAQEDIDDVPKNYSYTSDYLLYQKCPRQYMIFRKYGFVASRSQTMFFGSVVHKTIEDLHHLLMARREKS